jgi:hypothetical protein
LSQSIFLLDSSVFKKKDYLLNVVGDLEKDCETEKLSLVYDPVAFLYLKKLANKDLPLFEDACIKYFSCFESKKKVDFEWYELGVNELSVIDMLGEAMLSMDGNRRQISAYGLLPVVYDNLICHLYFHMSVYDIPDVHRLVSDKDALKAFGELEKTTSEALFNKRRK